MTLTEEAKKLPIWVNSDTAYGPESQTVERMNEIRALLIQICARLDALWPKIR